MSLLIPANIIHDTATEIATTKNPGEKDIEVKKGAMTPAAIHATAKLVKNSENIFPII